MIFRSKNCEIHIPKSRSLNPAFQIPVVSINSSEISTIHFRNSLLFGIFAPRFRYYLNCSRYFESNNRTITNKVNCIWYIREDCRDGRRGARGVLVRGGRATQMIAQESMEEHIRGSVERLDNQFSTLHQDVATLSCEVLYLITSYTLYFKAQRRNCFIFIQQLILNLFQDFLNASINKLKIIDSEKFIRWNSILLQLIQLLDYKI